MEFNTPWVWRRVTGSEVNGRYFFRSSDEIDGETYTGWERVDYIGKGIGGFQLCETGDFAVSEWGPGTFHFTHCHFSRTPLIYSIGREPEELRAYRALQDGDLVNLTRETYTDASVLERKEGGIPFLSFDSRKDIEIWGYGINPFKYGALGSQYYWTEPYVDEGTVNGPGCS